MKKNRYSVTIQYGEDYRLERIYEVSALDEDEAISTARNLYMSSLDSGKPYHKSCFDTRCAECVLIKEGV